MFVIEDELKKLPDKPGVYLMHNSDDTIIYVGKAKVLKNRVRQYFRDPARLTPKIRIMVSQIAWFEYIVVDSEKEALVLECNLIKEHMPKYNAMLKDDKTYPYIKVTVSEEFPRVYTTRKLLRDKERYFGPYTNVTACNQTMELLRKLYKIRYCSRRIKEGDKLRPCLYNHIGQCAAPCDGGISKEEYGIMITEIIRFLSGDSAAVIKSLTAEMLKASEEMRFEDAAQARDKINAVNAVLSEQKATDFRTSERDIIAFYAEGDEAVVQLFFMRGGKLIGREHFFMTNLMSTLGKDVLSEFIKQYYSGTPYIPAEILCETEPEDIEVIREYLSEIKGQKVHLIVPKKGQKEHMTEMARENARMVFKKDKEKLVKEQDRTDRAVKELLEYLPVESIKRIESYDISNISGFLNVGSMVVWENGKLKKNDYRKFRIKSVEGADDYSSMKELLTRRFTHGIKDGLEGIDSGFRAMPDIIFMDGGKGQVNVAKEVLSELKLNIPVCGMVKDDRHRTRGLFFENVEIPVDIHGEAFKLITRIQDETHRFAITYHKSLRSTGQLHSILDDIPGIGPVRRKALMRGFDSIEAIKNATEEELLSVEGMDKKSASAVYDFFRKKEE